MTNNLNQSDDRLAAQPFQGLVISEGPSFSNWGLSRTTNPAVYVEPISYADVQAVVRDVKRFPTPVNPVGSLLSVTSTIVNDGGTMLCTRKLDEIVEFAEIGKMIDTPVKRYSSGMYVRLGFSVAAHLEPEILLVDEVLAVGDAEFQKKCLGRMSDVAREGRVAIPARLLGEYVAQLPAEAVRLDHDSARPRVRVACGSFVECFLQECAEGVHVDTEDHNVFEFDGGKN
jgi:hypothetical protein